MTTNTEEMQGLKNFIEATVSGQLKVNLKGLEERLTAKIDGVEKKVNELAGDVADTISASNDSTDSRLDNYEKRILNLENRRLRTA